MTDYGKAVRKLLREAGCTAKRSGKGDHEIGHSPITNRSFPVDHKVVSRHTANGVLKQAGLIKAF